MRRARESIFSIISKIIDEATPILDHYSGVLLGAEQRALERLQQSIYSQFQINFPVSGDYKKENTLNPLQKKKQLVCALFELVIKNEESKFSAPLIKVFVKNLNISDKDALIVGRSTVIRGKIYFSDGFFIHLGRKKLIRDFLDDLPSCAEERKESEEKCFLQ